MKYIPKIYGKDQLLVLPIPVERGLGVENLMQISQISCVYVVRKFSRNRSHGWSPTDAMRYPFEFYLAHGDSHLPPSISCASGCFRTSCLSSSEKLTEPRALDCAISAVCGLCARLSAGIGGSEVRCLVRTPFFFLAGSTSIFPYTCHSRSFSMASWPSSSPSFSRASNHL